MILTTRGRYAVMAIIDIAINSKGKPISLVEVAARQEIALNYLEQLFIKLKAIGVVKSIRGPGGGYILAADPSTIKIANIIDAVEENIKITRCHKPKLGCTSGGKKCVAHDLWYGLGETIRSYLDNISISDVMNGEVR